MTKNEVIDQLESLLGHCKTMRESGEIWARDCEALRIAIAALRGPTREQVEKVWRGEWTGNFNAHCSLCDTFSTMAYIGQGGNFCPNCGAPLTDEAVEIILRRLEALHENDR